MNAPSTRQLHACPELGVLALLEFALDLATRELVASHPQLDGDETPYWILDSSPSGHAARLMLPRIHRLLDALDQYRRLATREQSSEPLDDDALF